MEDEVVLSPTFIEKLKEIVVVMRPFVHWCVVANLLSQIRPVGLTPCSGSLNDMMTIQGEEPSEDESGDEDAGQDDDE